MKYILTILFLANLFQSCTKCGDNSEPHADIHFNNVDMEVDSIKALHSDDFILFEVKNRGFPLSMVSDTTTYLFFKDDKIDTISIQYKRNFTYQSDECGFIINLSDFQNLPQTTFDSIKFYIGYYEYDGYEYLLEVYN